MTRKPDNKPKHTRKLLGKQQVVPAPRHPGRSAASFPPCHPERSAQRGVEGSQNQCALCPVFGRCGGCSQLDVPYERQLAAKQQEVADLFANMAPESALLPILGMEDPFHYRNKVVSPYAPAKGKRASGKMPKVRDAAKGAKAAKAAIAAKAAKAAKGASAKLSRSDILTGMYAPGSHRLVPTDACAIENETAKRVTLAIRDIMARWNMAPYDEDAGTGFVRHAVVRVGHKSGEVLVTVVTNGDEFPSAKAFCRELVKRVPEITAIVQNVNTRQTNVILGEKERVLYGPGFILDTLCGLSFRISSQSFYQVNATQTEVLYNEAIRLANLTGAETVIDAYCGTGTIGLVAAKRGAARVIGVDSVASSIRDAVNNARHNGVENAEFIAQDATQFMKEMAASRRDDSDSAPPHRDSASCHPGYGAASFPPCHPERSAQRGVEGSRDEPLVLLMDPPRAGSTSEFLAAACELSPERIVYISCNPTTQARDVKQLVEGGYQIKAIRPVDMFPHTGHVESIVMLEKGMSKEQEKS